MESIDNVSFEVLNYFALVNYIAFYFTYKYFVIHINTQVDPESFWNFFYSAVFILLLLLAVKSRRSDEWGDHDSELEVYLRKLFMPQD